MLKCLNSKTKRFEKNDIIIFTGSEINSIGIVLEGTVQILKEDITGNRVIVDELTEGGIFGETFVCADIKNSPVTVAAVTDSRILFIDFKRIISICTSACDFHVRLVRNMLLLIAKKNIMLNRKLDIVSKKSIREKLIAYLDVEIKKQKSKKIHISFTRDEMADYLCVNRSAMSRELCKMRDQGILKFNKKTFELLT